MPSLIKSIARNVIFPIINKTGINRLIAKNTNKNLLILNYHGVVPEPDFEISPNHLKASEFEKQIQYFSRHYNVLNPNDLIDQNNKQIQKNKINIVITFDDGYENNYQYAFPILKKYNCPAIIFPVTSLIDTTEATWYDKIDITKSQITEEILKKRIKPLLEEITGKTYSRIAIRDIKNELKLLSKVEKDNFFHNYFKFISSKSLSESTLAPYYKMLSKEQIRELLKSNLIHFGSHTHTHPNLDSISREEMELELITSKEILEEITKKDINSIAFPDGAYNSIVKETVRKKDYKIQYAVNFRLDNDQFDKDIFKRFSVSNTTNAASTIFHALKTIETNGMQI